MGATTADRWRAIFISDVHLGTRSCRADALIAFLRRHEADTIYLVGDLVDFWRLKHRTHWPQQHNDVIQKLMRQARKGTRIVVIPGNHDEALDRYCGSQFGNIEVVSEAIHESADGRLMLVTHGDDFDGVVRYARCLAALSELSCVLAASANALVNGVRWVLGLGHWSLAAFLKAHVKQATAFIDRFEQQLAGEARRRGMDGVICGHIHHAANKTIDGLHYLNCGDWVDSCTALAENHNGGFHLLRWHSAIEVEEAAAATAPQRPAAIAA